MISTWCFQAAALRSSSLFSSAASVVSLTAAWVVLSVFSVSFVSSTFAVVSTAVVPAALSFVLQPAYNIADAAAIMQIFIHFFIFCYNSFLYYESVAK